jgi:hypothetical protein
MGGASASWWWAWRGPTAPVTRRSGAGTGGLIWRYSIQSPQQEREILQDKIEGSDTAAVAMTLR